MSFKGADGGRIVMLRGRARSGVFIFGVLCLSLSGDGFNEGGLASSFSAPFGTDKAGGEGC
jgi:hypothetical protein